jgi:hypothetical protein
MRIHTSLLTCLLFALANATLAQGPKLGSAPDAAPDCSIGVVTIAIDQRQVSEGDECVLEYTFAARDYSQVVYNPYFDRRLILPGKVVVSNAGGVVLGDAIQFCLGSMKYNSWDDWVRVPSGSHIGTRISFRMTTCFGGRNLPPGRYQVQLQLYKSFIANPDYS